MRAEKLINGTQHKLKQQHIESYQGYHYVTLRTVSGNFFFSQKTSTKAIHTTLSD